MEAAFSVLTLHLLYLICSHATNEVDRNHNSQTRKQLLNSVEIEAIKVEPAYVEWRQMC